MHGIDASTFEVLRKTTESMALLMESARARAQTSYQYIQLR